jgi:hypothetical protein
MLCFEWDRQDERLRLTAPLAGRASPTPTDGYCDSGCYGDCSSYSPNDLDLDDFTTDTGE